MRIVSCSVAFHNLSKYSISAVLVFLKLCVLLMQCIVLMMNYVSMFMSTYTVTEVTTSIIAIEEIIAITKNCRWQSQVREVNYSH